MESVKTRSIVLRRTNYGEADRVLNVLTPVGKMSVMAKGVRKERSKLAGGIELFCVSDIVVHKGKGDLGVLTSARLVEFYGEILRDLQAMELVGGVLREVSRRAEQVDVPEYFDLVWQVLRGVNQLIRDGMDDGLAVVLAWWQLNLLRASGEEVNLRTDVDGAKLVADKKYRWDGVERALREDGRGSVGAEQIKLMRLMMSSSLQLVLKVKGVEGLVEDVGGVIESLK